jgi:hypothetical protein
LSSITSSKGRLLFFISILSNRPFFFPSFFFFVNLKEVRNSYLCSYLSLSFSRSFVSLFHLLFLSLGVTQGTSIKPLS